MHKDPRYRCVSTLVAKSSRRFLERNESVIRAAVIRKGTNATKKASELQKNGNFENDEKTDSIILSEGGKNMLGTIF